MSGSRRNRFWRGVLMAAVEEAAAAAAAGVSSAERLLGWARLISPASASWRQNAGEAAWSILVSGLLALGAACLVDVPAGRVLSWREGMGMKQFHLTFIYLFVSVTHSVCCHGASFDVAIVMTGSIFRGCLMGPLTFASFPPNYLVTGRRPHPLFSVLYSSLFYVSLPVLLGVAFLLSVSLPSPSSRSSSSAYSPKLSSRALRSLFLRSLLPAPPIARFSFFFFLVACGLTSF